MCAYGTCASCKPPLSSYAEVRASLIAVVCAVCFSIIFGDLWVAYIQYRKLAIVERVVEYAPQGIDKMLDTFLDIYKPSAKKEDKPVKKK